jgi:hypothetical protein
VPELLGTYWMRAVRAALVAINVELMEEEAVASAS